MENIVTGFVEGRVRQQALWFIHREKERILDNYFRGVTGKEQAIGGLHTLYQIASYIRDTDCMRNLWLSIADIQNARFPGLRPSERTGLTGL